MTELPPAAQKVQAAALAIGLAIDIKLMDRSTRTADEAAAACSCAVGQIVKSLIFRGVASGKPILILVSGAHRVDETSAAAAIGEAIERPEAAYVREVTGFAIGGIPPFGHAQAMACFMDEALLDYDEIWAAAGTPKTLFSVAPRTLQQATGARLLKIAGAAPV